MNRRTLILVDAGFLSKFSQYLGNGKYLKFDITSLLNIFAKKEVIKDNLIEKRNEKGYKSAVKKGRKSTPKKL